jgi:hypothetical protein
MKKLIGCLLGAMLLLGGISLVGAQETSGTMSEAGITPPPKVLEVIREFTKPGKSGAIHEKSESAFVQAFARAKWPTHYFAATSITGKNRTLFFVGYDSYEAWEKDSMAQQKNAGLSAALDRASVADGDLLSEIDTSLLRYDEEQSLRAPVDIAHMRYFEISLYRVRAGHRKEWSDLVKLVKDGYDKVSDVHWAMYDADYGQEDVTYVVIIPLKSAAEIDESESHDKQFREALGEDGMKKLTELESSAVEFYQTNLFQFAPSMSYPPDAWVKADPDFWKVKAAPAAKAPAKTEEKPAAKQ